MREPAGDALEVGEHAVAALGVETIEGGIEELAVIHRQKPATEPRGSIFLELFQL
jgi:hypothetical protein